MKKWYKSKTILINTATFIAIVVPILSSQLDAVVGTEMALRIAAAAGVINALVQAFLRAFVDQTTPIQRSLV